MQPPGRVTPVTPVGTVKENVPPEEPPSPRFETVTVQAIGLDGAAAAGCVTVSRRSAGAAGEVAPSLLPVEGPAIVDTLVTAGAAAGLATLSWVIDPLPLLENARLPLPYTQAAP